MNWKQKTKVIETKKTTHITLIQEKQITSKRKQNQVQTYHILETNLTFAANYKEWQENIFLMWKQIGNTVKAKGGKTLTKYKVRSVYELKEYGLNTFNMHPWMFKCDIQIRVNVVWIKWSY
jgi:hypothetical protein